MSLTKKQFNKETGRQFYQYVQSFSEKENITPAKCHEIGVALAEKLFPDYEVVIATHCNTDNLHNHLLINSVSFSTGKKIHQNHDTLINQRKLNDELCLSFGLQTLDKYEKNKDKDIIKSSEYRAAQRGNSWKFRLMATIDECMCYSKYKNDFITLMKAKGYEITWTDRNTNTNPDIKQTRADYKLSSTVNGNADRRIKDNDPEVELPFKSINSKQDFVTNRENKRHSLEDKKDFRTTGWEHEREIFFGYQNGKQDIPLDIQLVTREGINIDSTINIANSLLQLGRTFEMGDRIIKIAPPAHIDKKRYKKLVEKKLSQGQKLEKNHDFEITM